MTGCESSEGAVEVHARNVGGIDETTVTFGPGPTVLSGRNATNRTSFLRAIMTVLGSDDVSLKGDADEGEVSLRLDGTTYDRRLVRENGAVTIDGDPYLEDPEFAELFAFLLEANEIRRTVERDGDLRDLVVRPIDVDTIEAEIERLLAERDRIDEELDELADHADRRTDLAAERDRLDDEIEETRAALTETEAAIESAEAEVDESREETRALEERLDELGSLRTELEEVRFQVESNRESVSVLRDRREELAAELAAVEPVDDADLEALEAGQSRLQERKRALEVTIDDLRSIVQFNEDQLAGEHAGLLDDGQDDGTPTDRLLDDGEVVCWTCGSQVERDRIESTLDTLRDLRREKVAERKRVERDLADVRAERQELEERQRRRDQLQRELEEGESDVTAREARISELVDRKAALTDEVESIEESVEDLREREYDDVLSLHEEANHLEFELGRLEEERAGIVSEIESIDDRLADREALEERRAALEEELADLRTEVDRIEAETVAAFNDHMVTVLSLLEYENLERIWIERRRRESSDGRGMAEPTEFDLHVVRSAASGATYEDTLAHLSESEREVTGLVFALAGYLVHDVYEMLPFVLLDSLEAIDSERIAALVEYLSDYSDYLVVALLPEDARALPDAYQRVTEI